MSASKRLRVRDEPGIGAFFVELHLDPAAPPCPRMLAAIEIDQLRATKKIVGDRAEAIFEVTIAMAPPVMQASPI